ncbi:MAG: acylphosphatase, partial [Methylovirgula sp.]
MSSFEKIVRVNVSGRVQGVGFRAFVQRHAEARRV